MDLGLTGAVVFVSGSSRGLGLAIAERFLAEGALVTLTGRGGEALAAAAEGLSNTYGSDRVFAFCGDLTDAAVARDALATSRERWGGLDHLVANVGSGRSIPGFQVGEAEWNRVLDLNFRSAVMLIEAALPLLMERSGATITAIGSIAGLEALGAPLAYSSAKAALAAYCGALAREIGPRGVRANCIAPGNILFPGGTWDAKLKLDRGAVERYIASEVPLNRFGSPEEIADLAVFLSSGRATFVTGACIIVDGGQTRKFM
jgi:3-oxoacyl-[acyl-carrier protein] reductase